MKSFDWSLPASARKGSRTARFAIFLLIAVATAALAQDHDRDRDHDRDHDRDRGRIFIVEREPVMRDFGGGRGGRPSPDAVCEPGFAAVGFHVQTGEFYNTAWLECARLHEDGDIGGEHRQSGRTGSPGGRDVHDAYCPPGLVLRGLSGRTAASIDEAAGECTPVRDIVERSPQPRTELTQPVDRPGAGGRPAEVACPIGFVVTGFRSMSGEYMDHLWLLCSEVQRRHGDDR